MATVRISDHTQDILRQLASDAGESMQDVADRAVEAYRRRQMIERTNAVYATMRLAPRGWDEELRERADWDATLADGLEDS